MRSVRIRLFVALLIPFVVGRIAAGQADPGPKLGLQTWTCRKMTFEQVVEFASSHKIKYLELTPWHLNPNAPKPEILRKKALLEQHGLVAYAFGVNFPGTDKEANRKLFELARLMGMKMIVVEPTRPAAWDNLEKLVKEYDIRLAIHNHGAGSEYADPAAVKRVLAARDPRIGVCLDIGWVTAAGFDAAKVFREYGDRVFDIHLKDKKFRNEDGESRWSDTALGEGSANLTGVFDEVRKTGWSGVMAIENDREPNGVVSGSIAFFRAHAHVTGSSPAP